ncbi:hypothetical protein Godav_012878 [Gossypium davidsonii]|uniref:Uncharacterized protein n=2 Tax=Gossypium TaxID=3633 RepID=A0A7J8RFD9_GOSDV|nr:hypothetical protein [Gossypium davidsonii]
MTIKTDPQNKNYVVESGATINKFEPWRAEDEEVEKEKQKRKSQGILGDAMKSLENRTLDSKREMDILAALDQIEIYEVYTCYGERRLINAGGLATTHCCRKGK